MSVKISHKELHESCLVRVPKGSHFTIYNLPFGIFSTPDRPPGVGVAIGNFIMDLRVMAEYGLFRGIASKIHFESSTLNSLMSQGNVLAEKVRERIQAILTGKIVGFSLIREEAMVEQRLATMHLPVKIGDYTDFYSSLEHATNVGKLFRSAEEALLPNWRYLPVGYHGRASSIITSGTPVRRPSGQIWDERSGQPVFSPTKKLDYELELAFFTGRNSVLGQPIPISQTDDYIFGMVLMNDWSARDIQQWEYRPLGPFLGKSFATAISPWVVLTKALEPYRVKGPTQKPAVLPYLKKAGPGNYDIQLTVDIKTKEGFVKNLTESNSKYLYWSMAQQLAHQTVNGCNVHVGDLYASGTISGPNRNSLGSLLEKTFNGKEPVEIHPGVERTFIADGDEIIMSGWAGEGNYKVGFGEMMNVVLPAVEGDTVKP